jgi:hypothetical protein
MIKNSVLMKHKTAIAIVTAAVILLAVLIHGC